MKVHIEAPSKMDLVDCKVAGDALDLTPLTLKGSSVIRLAYITVVGDKGSTAKAILTFNGSTGDFAVRRVDGKVATLPFDEIPPEDYDKKIEERVSRASRLNKKSTPTAPTDPPSQVAPPTPPANPPGSSDATPH